MYVNIIGTIHFLVLSNYSGFCAAVPLRGGYSLFTDRVTRLYFLNLRYHYDSKNSFPCIRQTFKKNKLNTFFQHLSVFHTPNVLCFHCVQLRYELFVEAKLVLLLFAFLHSILGTRPKCSGLSNQFGKLINSTLYPCSPERITRVQSGRLVFYVSVAYRPFFDICFWIQTRLCRKIRTGKFSYRVCTVIV